MGKKKEDKEEPKMTVSKEEEKKQIEHSKMMASAKVRGASPTRLKALVEMEMKRRKKRARLVKKTMTKPLKGL